MLTDELKKEIKKQYVEYLLNDNNSVKAELEWIVEFLDDTALINVAKELKIIPSDRHIKGYLKYFNIEELQDILSICQTLIKQKRK